MSATHREDYRNPACVEAWPEAWSCDYDPACCRFPKSCSAGYTYRVPDDHEHTWEQVTPYRWACTTCPASGRGTDTTPPTPRAES